MGAAPGGLQEYARDATPEEMNAYLESAWNKIGALDKNPDDWYNCSDTSIGEGTANLAALKSRLGCGLHTTRMNTNYRNEEAITGAKATTMSGKPSPTSPQLFEAMFKVKQIKVVYVLAEKEQFKGGTIDGLQRLYTSLGAETKWKPQPDEETIPEADLDSIARNIIQDLASGRSVLVHCLGGMGRTGQVIVRVLQHVGRIDIKRARVEAMSINPLYLWHYSQVAEFWDYPKEKFISELKEKMS